MKAAILTGVDGLVVDDAPKPDAGPGEVVVQVVAAALNRRDAWIKSGQYAGLRFPLIPGSDASGVVHEVGPGVDTAWVGREVIINPALDWGRHERAQEPRFSILGLPRDGTMAEYVHVPACQLASKPTHLSWTEAAALPLAGLTAYRALFTRARLQSHEKALITGIGGGVATLALQYAAAAGAIPFVTSSSPEKLTLAAALGARHGALYTMGGWARDFAEHYGPFDVIIDSAGGPGFGDLVDLCAPGGRLVFFGATRGNPPEIPMRKLFWRQINLLGSTMGSPADFKGMTEYVSAKAIHPVVSQIFPLDAVSEAFALMESGGQFGKIVITVGEPPA